MSASLFGLFISQADLSHSTTPSHEWSKRDLPVNHQHQAVRTKNSPNTANWLGKRSPILFQEHSDSRVHRQIREGAPGTGLWATSLYVYGWGLFPLYVGSDWQP